MTSIESYSELQLAAILKTQREIKKSPVRMFRHVLKEERTREPVIIAPHQQVAIEFMHAHRRSVHIWPVNHAKTTSAIAMILWQLFINPSSRIAIVSATQAQSAKILSVVKNYIEFDDHYKLFTRDWSTGRPIVTKGDKWTDTAITIARPPGIKDPSVVAVGLDGSVQGSRLDLIIADDVLNAENTHTKEGRNKVLSYIDNTFISRLEADGRIILSNSAWHPDDALHVFRRLGFASLLMQVTGEIYVKDDVENINEGRFWDSDLIEEMPGGDKELGDRVRILPEIQKVYELNMQRRKGLVPSEEVMLWNPHPSIKSISELRMKHPIDREFNRLYMSNCRDDGTSMCKAEWIERAKEKARVLGYTKLPKRPVHNKGMCFTGVDLAVSKADGADDTSILTFEILPSGDRLILDIEIGKFSGPEIVQKLVKVHDTYGSIVRVENNGCLLPGTMILTQDKGYVPVESIVKGDMVWTHKGRWRAVTDTLSATAKNITNFKARGSIGFGLTPNHWAWMRKAGRTPARKGGHHRPVGEAQWVSAGFAEHKAYVGIARPVWPACPAVIDVQATEKKPGATIVVNEAFAMVLGLFLAEGHATQGQVFWTMGAHEVDTLEFIAQTVRSFMPDANSSIVVHEGVARLVIFSKGLADAFRPFGKKHHKGLPMSTMGWPLELRMAVVRGWLVGDGCLGRNGGRVMFSGDTISRNLAAWMRATLLQAGMRPAISYAPARKPKVIDGRVINGGAIYSINLPSDDSRALRAMMTTPIEDMRFGEVPEGKYKSGGAVILDGDEAWSHVDAGPGDWDTYNGPVHNLVVDGDESYTAEDVIVHNAQDFLLQFMRDQQKDIPIRPHTTGSNKSHPQYGVAGMFVELFNGYWLFPSDRSRVEPAMQRLIDACLYYTPESHTDDSLMSWWFAREQAREFGLLKVNNGRENVGQSISMSVMSR